MKHVSYTSIFSRTTNEYTSGYPYHRWLFIGKCFTLTDTASRYLPTCHWQEAPLLYQNLFRTPIFWSFFVFLVAWYKILNTFLSALIISSCHTSINYIIPVYKCIIGTFIMYIYLCIHFIVVAITTSRINLFFENEKPLLFTETRSVFSLKRKKVARKWTDSRISK